MPDLPTLLVVGPIRAAAVLERAMAAAGFCICDGSSGTADVALVLADPATDLPTAVRRVLADAATRVVVVAPMGSARSFIEVVAAGADGWVLPTIDPTALGRTLIGVHAGESGFSRLDTVALVAGVRGRRTAPAPILRPRPGPTAARASFAELGRAEMRVVTLVADGLNNREIAEQLYLSRHTIESHLKRVYAKLHIRSRVELTRLLLHTEQPELDIAN